MNIIHHPLIRSLLNSSSEAMLIFDEKLRLLDINETAKQLYLNDLLLQKEIKNAFEFYITDPTTQFPQKKSLLINNQEIEWQIEKIDDAHNIFYLIHSIELKPKLASNEIFQLETLIENMPCNVYWVDRDCKMINCNQNVLNMLNMTREDFKGKTYEELAEICAWPEGLCQKLKNDDLTVMESGVPIFGVEDPPVPHADGTFSNFLSNRVPLRNKDGEVVGIAGISVEITALKEARANAELASLAKTEFIANMSHDIRTPLSGIVGLSELLEELAADEEQKQFSESINQCAEQLLGLLNGILDVVSADNVNEHDLHFEDFELRHCLQSLVDLERPSTKLKGLSLLLDIEENVPLYLFNDRTKIHRILLNLLGNAIKFTKEGSVTIKVNCVSNCGDQTKLRFEVIDTGIGIAKDKLNKVFERFYRISPSYKGVYTGHGLGLHIAQEYANLLETAIHVTSEEGKGTTFYFDLTSKIGRKPTKKFEDNRLKDKKEKVFSKPSLKKTSQPTASINAPKVLLIEDNTIALKMAETFALRAGLQYQSAIDGESGLELAKNHPFDLIVSDIGLPGISGIQFTKLFREWEAAENKKPIPIVALTAHVRDEAKLECLQAGITEVFTKPVSLEIMKTAVSLIRPGINGLNDHILEENTPKTTNSLGVDLPDTEDELFTLDQYSILDKNLGIQNSGSEELLLQMLDLMANQELPKDIEAIKKAHESQDWTAVEKLAHKMKGGAVYLGTVRMKYACQYLERYIKAGHSKLCEPLYQQLLNVLDETLKAMA
ncbi:sensory box histidine kinase/response regulator [Legionella adelaidensis]|uniref:histidine kinase n=1 Tax=Legionella adelaidensis TaxID=45056 RepID=A0A0W0R116_9GAMM|nr:ATP-binding protein [Legionella adelaidensis]KTC64788.1 sensory box histidine kinase/response regulator [Legionella adelaidensis]